MDIKLTSEQIEIATYDREAMLVRGVAGSGKTLCLVENAINKAKAGNRVLFITYNKDLKQKIDDLMRGYYQLEVKNVDAWTWGQVNRHVEPLRNQKPLWDTEKNSFIRAAMGKFSSTNRHAKETNENLEFLGEEFTFITGKNIRSLNEYLETSREGRGLGLRREDRTYIYQVFEAFQGLKKGHNKYEFVDLPYRLVDVWRQLPTYDYVCIDEGQDLHQVMMMVFARLAKKGFYVCADDGQKLYKTHYTWTSVGVNFRGGRSRKLNKSFRSTYEIFKFASEMQKNDTSRKKQDDLVEPVFDESNAGEKPLIFNCTSVEERTNLIIEGINDFLEVNPQRKIGILCKDNYSMQNLAPHLRNCNGTVYMRGSSPQIDFSADIFVTTLHSSKGMEYDYVIVPQFELDTKPLEADEFEEYWNAQRKLYYVAFSRARHQLDVMYVGPPNQLLAEITKETYELGVE